ncbi:electron transfer flavoprotein subunit alpha/FixB family protein [Halobacterium bonnevillei]|uniref:Electron transfer flavoprotein subunit alpha/FixB family protein n=1 Tax=Halobacterium bonnevillei TaxID=2692200 RepID=A0A6B0SPS4_9EURY|nr:electron transfer flavoprotein subunit alpha/FixB family protein [Halobacterium bonnevillei]MXR20840.1 electron transfer flavoprotein subunit alpha/FixB family protein [Halobacterium bonnevillei]
MPALDPNDYDISELGPEIQSVEDLDELEDILEAEKAGKDRVGAKKLIESRIEKFREDEDDGEDLDPTELSPADLANELQAIDSVERLEEIIEAEEAGEDRDSVKRLVNKRIDSIQGSDETDGEIERVPPEEKYPELNHPTEDKQYVEDLEDGVYEDMWVYCETDDGELLDVSREMLGKARSLMDGYNEAYGGDERVVGVLIGDGVSDLADEVIACGADVVVSQEHERLRRFRHKPYTELFAAMARAGGELDEDPEAGDSSWREYDEPRYTLFPATNNGRDLSALVQGELDSGLASDCSGLYIEDTVISNPAKTHGEGQKREFQAVLHMKRPDFSGFEYSTILCLDNPAREFHPQGASVIPGSFEVPEPDDEREGEVYEYDFDLEEDWFRVQITDYDDLDSGVDLTGRDVIVALGRGIGDDPTLGMELGVDLADAFEDADLGITRGIVTSSYDFDGHVEQYASEERQIGETGQIVEPDLYVAAGISGAIQHKVGMDDSDTIVTVNTDTDADIREFSDYFIEGDLFDVLPALTEAVESGELDVEELAATGGASDD